MDICSDSTIPAFSRHVTYSSNPEPIIISIANPEHMTAYYKYTYIYRINTCISDY
jgi:hypothetical protein